MGTTEPLRLIYLRKIEYETGHYTDRALSFNTAEVQCSRLRPAAGTLEMVGGRSEILALLRDC